MRVIDTIDRFNLLATALDTIRQRHFASMTAQQRASMSALLVNILDYVTQSNANLYPSRGLPYAGEGIRPQRRLLSCFLSVDSQPQVLLGAIRGYYAAGYLASETGRLQTIAARARTYQAPGPNAETDSDRLRTLQSLVDGLQGMTQRK